MTTANVNYINSVFEFPVLTKITGRPQYSDLKAIKDELKANAGKVQCELGGGNNGHLGLTLLDAEYTLVSPTAYIRPAHPGAVIPTGATQIQNTNLRAQYNEDLRLFREATAVEEALTKQLSDALPPHYLKKYRNVHSNKINTPIRDILGELFATYGAISDEELADKETTLKARIFDITQPLVELFNAVEELQLIATASSSPFTDKQMVSIGMKLIRNMNDYEKARGDWMAKPRVQKTWTNFKLHFDDAYSYLLGLRGETMRNTAYQHQANMLTNLITEVNEQREADKAEMFRFVDDAKSTILDAMTAVPSLLSEDTESPSELTQPSVQTANSTQQDTIQLKMLQILERIDKKLDERQSSSQTYTRQPTTQTRTRKVLDCYCWSHGAGNHKSADCRNKKQGHKDNATFKNRMSGSNAYCKVADESK